MPTAYENMSTPELRKVCLNRGAFRGRTWRGIRRTDLEDFLEGRATEHDIIAKAEGTPFVSKEAQQEPPAGDDLVDVIARALAGKVKAGLDETAVLELLRNELDARGVDEPGIKQLIGEAVEQFVQPITHEIHMPEVQGKISLAGQATHYQLTQVLAWLRADVPIWLWGAPGAGKTHMGRQLADCLSVKCYTMSIDETTTANKLLGFQNLVSGAFVEGWLYEPYKDGGLVVIDEIDTGNPGIIAGLNALLANDYYMFPNGETLKRHDQFRVIACANTNGTGAIAGYTARQRLDAATLNRFAVVECLYDEGLELQLACGVPSRTPPWEPGKVSTDVECLAWVKWVQDVRSNYGRSVLISPRASMLGTRALRGGIAVDEVAHSLVFALCAEDTVSTIKGHCHEPADVLREAMEAV